MLRLVTLGRIDLTDAHGHAVEAILKRPKRLALLTYLGAGGPGALRSRDTVVGLFWPDETQARARQSLNQALYVLRQELGKDVVLSVGNDQIGLAPGGLWCDAAALRAAEASGDHRSVAAHYRGDFLPGFYLNDAPDFERWLENERATLRRLASSSAWKLAEEAGRAGDVETAAAAAVRSAELALREEAAVRRAIELLDGLGERARALDLYRELEADLAEDLGTRPAPETQEVVARMRQREASPEVAEVLRPDPGVAVATPRPRAPRWTAAAGSGQEPAPGPATGRRRGPLAAALAALAAVAVLAAVVWMLSRPPEEAVALDFDDPHVLIEPFDAYAGDDRLTDLADAITEGLAAQLAEVDAFDVLLLEAGAQPPAPDSAAPAGDGGLADARAQFVVRGRVLRDGDRMRALVSLIDRPSGQVIASATIERVTADAIAFVDEATGDAARFTRAAVGRELRERAWRASTTDATAWRLLERAEADRRTADELLDRGANGPADVALARADSLLALAADEEPRWLPPLVLRAHVAYDRMWVSIMPPSLDRDGALGFLGRGLEQADRALAIDSSEARAREMKGLLLYWSVVLQPSTTEATVDVLDQAEAELRGAVAVDPRRSNAWRTLSAIYMSSGRYEEAYHAAERAYAADAFLDAPHEILVKLFSAAFEAHDDDAAARWCDALIREFPRSPSAHQCTLTLLAWRDSPDRGDVEAARAVLEESTLDAGHPLRALLELQMAEVLARAGEVNQAEAILERVRASSWNAELVPIEASIHLALGHTDLAATRLRDFIAEKPNTRRGLLSGRRYDALRQ